MAFASYIHCAYALDHSTLFCVGSLDAVLDKQVTIYANGKAVAKPYLVMKTDSHDSLHAIIISLPHAKRLEHGLALSLRTAHQEICWQTIEHDAIKHSPEHFVSWLLNQTTAVHHRVTKLLIRVAQTNHHSRTLLSHIAHLLYMANTREHAVSHTPISLIPITDRVAFIARGGAMPSTITSVTLFNEKKLFSCDIHPIASENGTGCDGWLLFLPKNHHHMKAFVEAENFYCSLADIVCSEGSIVSYLREKSAESSLHMKERIHSVLIEHSHVERDMLATIRQLQHQFLPEQKSIYHASEPFGAQIEGFCRIGENRLLVYGWVYDPLQLLDDIHILSDLGDYYPLHGQMWHYPREDLRSLYDGAAVPVGFVSLISLTRHARDVTPLSFRAKIQLRNHERFYIAPTHSNDTILMTQERILSELLVHIPTEDDASAITCEALWRLQQQRTILAQCKTVIFPPPDTNNDVSIIIPLYSCLDYVKAQLSLLMRASEHAQFEVIFILDSPEDRDALHTILTEFSCIFPLPISLLVTCENAGFSMCCNLAAQSARGETLLFLNSDVLPHTIYWLDTMLEHYRATPGIGVLGPKLLSEDGVTQHVGMASEVTGDARFWEVLHPHKGGADKEETGMTQVPAVTGACMMIDRQLFDSAGGFNSDYIKGGFEDAEFCERLEAEGKQHFVLNEVPLIHLEGRSFLRLSEPLRHALFRYNRWLYSWNHEQPDSLKQNVMEGNDNAA